MNSEEQRVAIAEACGWKRGKREEASFVDPSETISYDSWIHPNGYPERRLPDYLNDLNAMHEAEKSLHDSQSEKYFNELSFVLWRDIKATHIVNLFSATASQRAEAFLRTIGKWKE